METSFKFTRLSKLNGIFNVSQSDDILNEYKNIVKLLSNKKINKLSKEELNKIFFLNEFNINAYEYEEIKDMFIFILELEFKSKRIAKFSFSIVKEEYNFIYNSQSYYCFILEDLQKYLDYIHEINSFHFIVKENGEIVKISNQINSFLFQGYKKFEIEIDYQYIDIDYKSFSIKDIYNKKNIKKGIDLNHKLGLYVELSKEEFDNFEFFETPQREKFFKFINKNLKNLNFFGICGPYGTGKTISLLRMTIQSNLNKYFYINLSTVFKVHNITLKNIMKYEMVKFFGKNIIEKENEIFNEEKDIKYKDFINLLNELKEPKSIFEFLKKFIKLIKTDKNELPFYIIIDQYSSKYDIDKKNIINLIKNSDEKIKIIICSTMDNDIVKYDLCNCLDEKILSSEFNNDFILYFYVGSLIKINNNEILRLQDYDEEFVTYLNNFGNLYIYYYKMKKYKDEPRYLKMFEEIEVENIKDNLNKFYQNNNNYNVKYNDMIRILNVINRKNIYFYDELKVEMFKFPLKYLEIKREKIELDDLELYGIASGDYKILKFFSDLEKNKSAQLDKLENLKNKFKNYIKLFNKDEYCKNYISEISEKKRKKIKYIKKNYNLKIDIFYLDFFFPLIEDIFSNIIYNKLIRTNILNSILTSQDQGGIIEYIINENTKHKKTFIVYNVYDFRTVENFVPNSFFIQNYTSRKLDTLKIYIKSKNIRISQKKQNLSQRNIYLMQRQFSGKYYDCGLLIYEQDFNYKLLLCQVSKRKIASQRYYREEHQIIFNRVKSKLENEFNITISKGYFSYILIYEEKDDATIEFCEKNNIRYFLFSINEKKFKNLDNIIINDILNDKAFITNDFPFHNSFTILPKKYFELKNGKFINLDYIEKIQKSLSFSKISNKIQEKLSEIFLPKHKLGENNEKNEFFIYGNFNEIFDVNASYCRFLNNDDLFFYCPKKRKEENKEKYESKKEEEKINEVEWEKIEFLDGSRLSQEKYTLICSKYKIKNP